MHILYATPHANIGVHDWRLIVGRTIDGKIASFFQYRTSAFLNGRPAGKWKHQNQWTGYDPAARPYCGLPIRAFETVQPYSQQIRCALHSKAPA